ncbi:class I SAM-dependent methyltransferase [bacterium]|nr:class I SAM-dependent methyltransferase [bacterium]
MIALLLKKNLLPDFLIRMGIRQLLRRRLKEEDLKETELQQRRLMSFVGELKQSPIAINTQAANEQHYEIPAMFYQLVLGKHLKYSSGYWRNGVTHIDQSEEDMLRLTIERAGIRNGDRILELGCGWGSLSLYMAMVFPDSTITAVSNSTTQKVFIDAQADQRGFNNLTVITSDMNDFDINDTFDSVVSVEMFEHMRNYQKLLAKVSRFLKPGGRLFVHIFTHREFAYPFEVRDESDWMAKYFFTGGIMPCDHLLLYFQDHFAIRQHWRVSGIHYAKTSEAWLRNMNKNRNKILPLFEQTYGNMNAVKWWVYWRVFFMACAELWGFRNGNEWFVSHYLFERR